MEPIFPGSNLYQWSAPYEPNLLGIMRAILPLVQLKQAGPLFVDNIQQAAMSVTLLRRI